MNKELSGRVSRIYDFLIDELGLSNEEVNNMKSAISMVHELSPTDGPGLFSKMNNMISVSDDLSWIISVIRNKCSEIRRKIREIKDPDFVMLVRQGRPSTQAIESEIRFNHSEINDMEQKLEIFGNITEYLQSLNNNVDRYIWMLKDKTKYIS